jgi:hypothetical protein
MFFSLFHMSMGMDMSGNMTDCPFMVHDEGVICPMDFADHIYAWKSVFISVVPTVTWLLLLAGAVVLISLSFPKALFRFQNKSSAIYRWLRKRLYTFSHRALQDFFSSGVLNTKIY